MKEEIRKKIDNPRELEKLYRDNPASFKREFNLLYPTIQGNATAQIWNERLNFESDEISWGTKSELTFVVVAAFIAGLIAKIPLFTGISEDYFYPRNLAFVVFPFLIAYFLWRQKNRTKKLVTVSVAVLFAAFYINLLPDNPNSDTLILACIHLPLFLWAVLGYTFIGDKLKNNQRRLDFLRYNGELIVMTTIILISGGIMTAITLGLFELIDLNIEKFYGEYIVVWGLAAAPLVGTYLVQNNPQLVGKVSPVIAKVFTPLVLVTLVIYLCAVVWTGKDPYNDREFLLIFNILLVTVMAIIFFSVAEISKNSRSKFGVVLLFGLSLATIIVNGIALSAILFRIAEWGITPNRLAVLGSNMLILANLLMVSFRLFKTIGNKDQIENVEKSIASFLPFYSLWTIVVVFLFPLLFWFR